MEASETRYEGDNVTVMQNGAAKQLSADEKAELMADRFLID
jgi:hypothetical protein